MYEDKLAAKSAGALSKARRTVTGVAIGLAALTTGGVANAAVPGAAVPGSAGAGGGTCSVGGFGRGPALAGSFHIPGSNQVAFITFPANGLSLLSATSITTGSRASSTVRFPRT